jgi:predicted dehydrogenase
LGWSLTGVTDVRKESFEAAKADLGSAEFFSDHASMFAATRPDVAIIATTAPWHVPLALSAIEAGVPHILVEKPLGISVASCQALLAAERAGRSKLAVHHPMRFMPIYAEPIAWATAPEQGGFSALSIVSGAGGWAMIGSHFLEAFRLAAQEPIESVQAWLDPEPLANPRGAQFEDRTGQFRIVTKSGKRLSLEMGAGLGHGIRLSYAARNGLCHADLLAGTYETVARRAEDRELPVTRYGTPAERATFHVAPSDPTAASVSMLRALVEGGSVPSIQDGLEIVATVAAAYVSHEQGREVRVSEMLEHGAREFAWA